MRLLRSELKLIESQRELMQVNFALMGSIGTEMKEVTEAILLRSDLTTHMSALRDVRKSATDVVSLARKEDLNAFAAANEISRRCLNCHENIAPTSGHSWTQINSMNWAAINQVCNSEGRVPYTCKNMHGMLSAVAYFQDVEAVGLVDLQAVEKVGLEIARVATELKQRNAVHGSERVFGDIQTNALDISTLARQGLSEARQKAGDLVQSCRECHQ